MAQQTLGGACRLSSAPHSLQTRLTLRSQGGLRESPSLGGTSVACIKSAELCEKSRNELDVHYIIVLPSGEDRLLRDDISLQADEMCSNLICQGSRPHSSFRQDALYSSVTHERHPQGHVSMHHVPLGFCPQLGQQGGKLRGLSHQGGAENHSAASEA